MENKKIVLLGDSIRLIGYGLLVPGKLGEGYDVWQPTDNCRFAQSILCGCFLIIGINWKGRM